MADVRALLRNERTARRISHPQATYSTTGTLVCLVCHIQLKSESLWNGHLRSAQHAMRLQRIRDGTLGRPPGAPAPDVQDEDGNSQDYAEDGTGTQRPDGESDGAPELKSKKRKADDGGEQVRKRSRADGLPEGFFDEGSASEAVASSTSHTPPLTGQEIQLPSRPATPLKALENLLIPKPATVDEDEWAAFEADIAAAEIPTAADDDATISAPAMTTAELAAKSVEEENSRRKERAAAELEGDKEDAARKLEDEMDEMEALEVKIRMLKEKREALRLKGGDGKSAVAARVPVEALASATDAEGGPRKAEEDDAEEEEDDDDDDDDDWDGFRLKA